jgi:hypothetical protein
MKKLIITSVVVTAISLAIAGTAAIAIQGNGLKCNYDPKTGNYRDPNTGSWSAYGSWDVALACASKGLLPQNVADRIGSWGSKEDQATGKAAAETNKRVAAENAAKVKAEAKSSVKEK